MGDRCYCTLIVDHPTPELLELLEEHLGGPDDEGNEGEFFFEDVNWGNLPEAVETHLKDNKIPFVWRNESGGEYGEGVRIYDGLTVSNWLTNKGNIVLGLDELDQAPMAKEAQKAWEKLS